MTFKNVPKFFIIIMLYLFAASYASEQWIVKEGVVDPRFNNTDFRYIVSATRDEEIRTQEIEYLREFANLPKTIAVMICNLNNIDFVKEKITSLQNFVPTVRFYNNIPMLLNDRAASLLPKLNERNEKLSAFTVLVITLNEWHKRLVFMKDNKNYAQNVAGMIEDEDFPSDRQDLREDFAIRNTARRELEEEVRLSVAPERLLPIAAFLFKAKKDLINTEWTNLFAAFYCHLDQYETNAWLTKIGMNDINESLLCNSKRVTDNSETQWMFFAKPELFENRDIQFPIDDKTVPLPPLHSDVAAAVIQRVLNKENIFIGRGTRHLDGEVTYAGLDPMFQGCFDHLQRSEN